jgi:hypothetical protein
MSALFEPFTLKGITLRNRMLRRFDREPLIAEQVAYQRAGNGPFLTPLNQSLPDAMHPQVIPVRNRGHGRR